MSYDAVFAALLAALPCPVSKMPGGGAHETYAVFGEVLATPTHSASNAPRRLRHTVQVHLYSRRDDGTHETLLREAMRLLRAGGVRVYSYGPELYETETGYHHIGATCEWVEPMDET